MSNEKTENTQKAPENQKAPKSQNNPKGKVLTREERTEQKIARQIDLVQNKNYAAVPRRALETNAAIALLTKNDFLVDRLRDRLVNDPSIDIDAGITALKKNQKIREEINELNIAMCALMGLEYEAPRGFETASTPAGDGKKEEKTSKAA